MSRERTHERHAKPVVLGIWDGHDASVSLVQEGALVFALSEERPTRRKRYSGFPHRALAAALGWAAARGLEVSDVAVAGRWGRLPLRLLEPLYACSEPDRDELSLASALVRGWENGVAVAPGLRELERAAGLAFLRRRLRAALPSPFALHAVSHHEAHAWSALLGASAAPSLVVTWDAYGEGLAATARAAETPTRPSDTLPVGAGLARLYGAVTQALGFGEGDEGKVMGRAARGDPERGGARFRALFASGDGVPALARPLRRRQLAALLAGLSVEDAAAGLQRVTEDVAVAWVRRALQGRTTPRRLLLAGGLFANIRVNQRLSELPGVSGLFVFPNMVDGGLSAGAAARVWAERHGGRLRELQTAALGPPPEVAALRHAVERSGLPARRLDEVPAAIAAHLREGRAVAWYTGRDEFGPRALGQRSLLFPATDEGLAARINEALGRDPFMPFGPVLREEELGSAARTVLGPEDLAWMTISVDAQPALARDCPVAVHVDGSLRPQVVSPRRSPQLHAVLGAYRALGGAPAIINTSFNLHGEPIVHSPEDAVATFLRAGLDVLVLEDTELRREGLS